MTDWPFEDEPLTPEIRRRQDLAVIGMRLRWQRADQITDAANRAFEDAFRKALREP